MASLWQGGAHRVAEPKIEGQSRREIDLSRELNEAAGDHSNPQGGDGGAGVKPHDPGEGPGNRRPPRPQRTRKWDFDRRALTLTGSCIRHNLCTFSYTFVYPLATLPTDEGRWAPDTRAARASRQVY